MAKESKNDDKDTNIKHVFALASWSVHCERALISGFCLRVSLTVINRMLQVSGDSALCERHWQAYNYVRKIRQGLATDSTEIVYGLL